MKMTDKEKNAIHQDLEKHKGGIETAEVNNSKTKLKNQNPEQSSQNRAGKEEEQDEAKKCIPDGDDNLSEDYSEESEKETEDSDEGDEEKKNSDDRAENEAENNDRDRTPSQPINKMKTR